MQEDLFSRTIKVYLETLYASNYNISITRTTLGMGGIAIFLNTNIDQNA